MSDLILHNLKKLSLYIETENTQSWYLAQGLKTGI